MVHGESGVLGVPEWFLPVAVIRVEPALMRPHVHPLGKQREGFRRERRCRAANGGKRGPSA